ncbi:Invasion associated protein p60 [hydrothermal vent metagenome]|uniref:Invasion associated protein p60 n=1 Tax=hydrothermal vent metagenome TaxID=652676 RepID=A0A1W1BKF7_9ZZZZ
MVITVSDNNAIKQYNLPNNVKVIFFSVIGVIFLFILSLFVYIGSLNGDISDIKQHNQELTKNIEKNRELDKKFKTLQVAFENLKVDKTNQKLDFDKKIAQLESSIDKKVDQKYKKKLLADKEKRLRLEREKKIKLAKAKAKKEALAKKKAEAKKRRIAAEKAKKKRELLAKKARKKRLEEAKRKKKLAHEKKLRAKSKILKKIAKQNLGKHYVWGAVGPKNFDCSGFTSYVYKKKGIKIPRTSREQSKYGLYVKRKQLKAGDLIFFDTSRHSKGIVNHVGMYIGNNKFIHASSAKKRVVITSLSKPFYAKRFKWGRRILN